MATRIDANAQFNYTLGTETNQATSQTVSFYDYGEFPPGILEQVGTGTAPIAYPVNSDILLTYTFTPSDDVAATFTRLFKITLTNTLFNETDLMPVGNLVDVRWYNGLVGYETPFTLENNTMTIITEHDTILSAYNSTNGTPLVIKFKVRSQYPQTLSALENPTTLAFTVVSGNDRPVISTTTDASITIEGAAPIAYTALQVDLTLDKHGKCCYYMEMMNYTINLTFHQLTPGVDKHAVIAPNTTLLEAPEGVTFHEITPSGTKYAINENGDLIANEEIVLDASHYSEVITVAACWDGPPVTP